MKSFYQSGRGFVWIECDACTHQWVADVEVCTLGEIHPIASEHCPECGANYDMDLFAAEVVMFRS